MSLSPANLPNVAKAPRSASAIRYHPLLWTLAACSAGIAIDRAWSLSTIASLTIAAVCWSAWLIAWRSHRTSIASALLLTSVAAVAAVWHHQQWQVYPRDEIALAAGHEPSPVVLTAVAEQSPTYTQPAGFDPLNPVQQGAQSRLIVQVTGVRDGLEWRHASGTLRLRIDGHLLGVRAGDRLIIHGALSATEPPLNPGEFDYAAFARADRKLAHLWVDHPAAIKIESHGWPVSLSGWTDGSRRRARHVLGLHLSGDARDMADALILGRREQLSYEQNDAYFRTGMVHVLSISGLHIGILAVGLMWALRLGVLRRGHALIGVGVLTAGYALLIDAEPPAVRATLIVVVTCAAMFLGRDARPLNALAGAALVVLAVNPADLFRAGPLLSFLAAAVLAYCARYHLSRIERDPLARLIAETRPWPIRFARGATDMMIEATIVSLAIWLVSLPLVISQFHIATPISLALTPLLTLPIAIALFSGFGVLVFGVFLPPLATACAWIFTQSMSLIDGAIAWSLDLPNNHFWVPPLAAWVVAGFYAVIIWSLLRPKWRFNGYKQFATLACSSVVALAMPDRLPFGRSPELACTFLAVGHGCSVLLELPDGRKLLYDAGRLGPPNLGAASINAALFSRRITTLDGIVISHADVDHYNAVPELLERMQVKHVWLTSSFRQDQSAATKFVLDRLAARQVSQSALASGDEVARFDGGSIRVLLPPPEGIKGTDNANSVVLLIDYAGHRVLLTGDLEGPGLERLLAQPPVDCDVLLAPHHGSVRSNAPGCAAWCKPEWVVISGGHDASPLVANAYQSAGARVLNTAEQGASTFRLRKQGITVETFRGNLP